MNWDINETLSQTLRFPFQHMNQHIFSCFFLISADFIPPIYTTNHAKLLCNSDVLGYKIYFLHKDESLLGFTKLYIRIDANFSYFLRIYVLVISNENILFSCHCNIHILALLLTVSYLSVNRLGFICYNYFQPRGFLHKSKKHFLLFTIYY